MVLRNKIGFTLIELLVVIAIIAILAAILFPVFSAARDSGRSAKCMANLANIGRALGMYRDDYGGRNCHIWQGGEDSDQGCFYWVVTNYVGQRMTRATTGDENNRQTVYRCPSAPWLKQQTSGTVSANGTTYQVARLARLNVGFAYTLNETGWSVGKFPGGDPKGGGLMDNEFRRPSETIFVGEEMGWVSYGIAYGNGTPFDNNQINSGSGSDGMYSRYPAAEEIIPLVDKGPSGQTGVGVHHGSWCKIYNLRVSHTGGTNFMFYDGHVKLMKVTKGRNWRVDI